MKFADEKAGNDHSFAARDFGKEVTDIERLISRYLDRELSPEEEGTFHRILSESPEARRRLREMEMIRSAARRMPTLTMPTPQAESRLFQQLFAEESLQETAEKEVPGRPAVPFLSRIAATARRNGVVVATLLLAALIGGGSFWIGGEDSAVSSLPIADASSPLPMQETVSALGSSALIAPNSSADAGNEKPVLVEKKIRAAGTHGTGKVPTPERVNSAPVTVTDDDNASRKPESIANGEGLPFASTPPVETTPNVNQTVETSSWPPAELLADYAADIPATPNNTSAAAQMSSNSLVYATNPSRERRGDQTISASYRHGLSYVEDGGNNFTTQDFSLRVEGRFDNRHRLSLAVGQSPLVVERTSRTLPTGIDEKGPSTASAERVERFAQLTDEVWAGVGYGYAVVATKRIRLEPGLNFGVGERSLRFSAELPIRYRLTERFSVDLVASVSRVQPHDQIAHDVDRTYDRKLFLQVAEEQHPVFTTMGASIGLSFDIGQ